MLNQKVKYLVIPAAGFGSRVKKITRGGCKELLDVNGRPAVHHVIFAALKSGIENIVIIIRKGKEDIEKYFSNKDFAFKFFPDAIEELDEIQKRGLVEFVYQKEPKGECDAIFYAEQIINDLPFLVVYPDNIIFPYKPAINKLLHFFNKYNQDVIGLKTITDKMLENKSVTQIQIEKFKKECWKIKSLMPKGEIKNKDSFYSNSLSISGIYIAKPHYFDFIKAGRKRNLKGELTDNIVRNIMLEQGVELSGISIPGCFFNIGNIDGYTQCTTHFAGLKKRY